MHSENPDTDRTHDDGTPRRQRRKSTGLMRFEVVTVDPPLARKLLDGSREHTQRTIRRNKVRAFAHAIRTDQWKVTHQPIAVAPNGWVFDGQHRLEAVIEADAPISQLVAWDADPETFGVIDTGTARTAADSLKIAGYTNTAVLSAAVRAFLTYQEITGDQRGSSFQTVNRSLTTADVLDYLDTDNGAEIARAASSIGNRVAQGLGRYGVRTNITTTAMILKTRRSAIGPTAQGEFWERLTDGVMLDAHSPILALRRWYAGDGYRSITPQHRAETAIAVTLKSVNDYVAGFERSQLRWYSGKNAMPEPLTRAQLNRINREREEHAEAIEARLADEEAADNG